MSISPSQRKNDNKCSTIILLKQVVLAALRAPVFLDSSTRKMGRCDPPCPLQPHSLKTGGYKETKSILAGQ
jgi:hypothetical protein